MNLEPLEPMHGLRATRLPRKQAGMCNACPPQDLHRMVWEVQMNNVLVRFCDRHIKELFRQTRR